MTVNQNRTQQESKKNELGPNYSIRVLERASEILYAFTLSEPEKSLTKLSRETGLNKSTVFRILDTLEVLGWVTRDDKTGLYRLGLGIFELGSRAVKGLDFYNISRPHLEQLVKITGQTVHLGIHDDGKVLYLNKLETPGTFISQPSSIGLRLPLHCTAMGKILLAFAVDEDKIDSIIARQGLKEYTKNTITNKRELLKELEKVKEMGYAIDNEEVQDGLCCVAAPIKEHNCKVVAAISVSGLSTYFNDRRIPFLTNEVVKVAQCVSRDLGCRVSECSIF